MNLIKVMMIGVVLITATNSHGAEMADNARALYFNPSKAMFGGGGSAASIASNGRVGENFTSSDNGNLGKVSGGYYSALDNPGVTYTVELLRRGSNSVKQVTTNHIFKTGDKIRIHVSSNGNGVMHALHKGSSGNALLVPISNGGQVENGQDVTIPSKTGWLRFDENKGTEKIDLLFASGASAKQHGLLPQQSNPQSLMQNIRQVVDNYSVSKELVLFEQDGVKDLVIEGVASFPTSGVVNRVRPASAIIPAVLNAPAGYAVNTAGNPVAVKINL